MRMEEEMKKEEEGGEVPAAWVPTIQDGRESAHSLNTHFQPMSLRGRINSGILLSWHSPFFVSERLGNCGGKEQSYGAEALFICAHTMHPGHPTPHYRWSQVTPFSVSRMLAALLHLSQLADYLPSTDPWDRL